MKHTPTRVVLGVAAVIATLNTIRAVRTWAEDTLAQIDEALCRLTIDDDDDDDDDADGEEACVCGSVEHSSTKVAILETPAWLDNAEHGALPLKAEFKYDQSDALAIALTLTLQVYAGEEYLGSEQQTWGFARDILDTALSTTDQRMVGDGDVRAQYDGEQDDLWIWLYDTHDSEHRITTPAGPVRQFMATSFAIVPAGTESYDNPAVDDEIQDLLGRAGEQ